MQKRNAILIVFVLFAGLSGPAGAQERLGGPMPPSARAIEYGIGQYLYSRNGANIDVEVLDEEGRAFGRAELAWPQDLGPQIHYWTREGSHYFLGHDVEGKTFSFENTDDGRSAAIRGSDQGWKLVESEREVQRTDYFYRQKSRIALMIAIYEDAVTNLGFRNVQEMRGRQEIAKLRGEDDEIEPPARILGCVEFSICNGVNSTSVGQDFTDSGCCLQANLRTHGKCAVSNALARARLCPGGCCSIGCQSNCLFGDSGLICTCISRGRACGPPLEICDDPPPPLPPECI